MTDQELHGKIKQAFDHATPDVLDSVLDHCQGQKGTVITMTNKKKAPWIGRVAAIAASLALVIGLGFGYMALNDRAPKSPTDVNTTTSVITLDVNPSVELTVDALEKVTAVKAQNEDGQKILADMDLVGTDLDVAVNAIIGSMLRNGYLNETANSILVSVDSTHAATGAALQQKLTDKVNATLKQNAFNGAVITQPVTGDQELEALADRYDISIGKAKLIQRIMAQDVRYTFEELAKLSINALNLLTESGSLHLNDVTSSGAASEKGYIGADAAKTIALTDAGVTEADIWGFEIDMDVEKGILVYEVEFNTGDYEYEYDIDATNGTIVWKEKDFDRDDDGKPVAPPADTPPEAPALIGRDAAIAAAYKHAGLAADAVKFVECELDNDHGTYVYEIGFRIDGYEYEYDIDAKTGAVLKFEKDWDDDRDDDDIPVSPGYIGKDAAKATALAHAGMTADAIRDYDCELDTDDGKACYEIEFTAAGIEYDYKIDAVTGKILAFEKDIDD